MAKKLTEDEAREAIKYIKENTYLSEKGCPYCGSTDYLGQRELKAIPSASPDGEVDLGKGGLYFEVVCEECSSTHLFNFFHMGVLD